MATNNLNVSSMAEELSQQTLMVNKHVPIVDGSGGELTIELEDKDITSSDLPPRVVNETDDYDQSTFKTTSSNIVQENIHPLSDHSYIHTTKSLNVDTPVGEIKTQILNSVENSVITTQDISKNLLQNLQFDSDKQISDSSDVPLKSISLPEDDHQITVNNDILSFTSVDNTCNENLYVNETVNSNNPLVISEIPVSSSGSSIHTTSVLPSSTTSTSNSLGLNNLKLLARKPNAPLGSVENPIQITHKGNTYETTQCLTQAQLQQISYVLQSQKANKIHNGGKSILYDPSTNTRIVCRVVHPSELQGNNLKLQNSDLVSKPNTLRRTSTSSKGKGRSRKIDDDDKANSHLSREEREEKKKQRPRTRSGRISKPPSYMVKDYKRIHHLDFDEDTYDSDGGYSDYHVSDEEAEKSQSKEEALPPGVTTSKQRNFACQKCSKAYIGKGGLSRHYRLHPNHGNMPEGEEISTQDENSSSSLASSVLSSSGNPTNNQHSTNSLPQTTVKFGNENQPEKVSQILSLTNSQANSLLERRKSRLREVLKSCSDEELIDSVLPILAQKVSLWDFFLRKCDEKSDGLRIFEMLKEFEKFLIEMQKISHAYLSPASFEDHRKTIINISSKQIAEALSLERGAYFIKDSLIDASNITLEKNTLNNIHPHLPDEIIQPHAKRKRIDQSVEDVSNRLPDQILSDVHGSGSLELPLSDVTFTGNSDFQRQDNHHILNSTLSASDSQNDLASSKSLFDLNSSTNVTPSSLSSGCLSAVNSAKSLKANVFFSPNGAAQLHNLQMQKVQLLGSKSQPQVLIKNGDRISINGFTLSPDLNLSNLPSNKPVCLNNTQMDIACSDLAAKTTFQTLNLGTNIDVLNHEHQQTIGMCNNQINLAEISHDNQIIDAQHSTVTEDVSKSIVNCLTMADVPNSTAVISESEIQNCLPPEISSNQTVLEETREFEITPTEIISEVTKPSEASQVLRHFVLPDGQVIGVWSQMDSSEKSMNEQLVQNCLPGNLIIVQNPDGTLQVPNNQNLTLETL
ncbi:zinc finger protein [Trichonephila clavipes]|nr:zinc finger protein [Trichonephila clavipes]